MKYIDADRLMAEIRKLRGEKPFCDDSSLLAYLHGLSKIENFIDSLQQENEIVEFNFKGGTYRVNGEEHAFKGGKAKVIILEINQEEGNE